MIPPTTVPPKSTMHRPTYIPGEVDTGGTGNLIIDAHGNEIARVLHRNGDKAHDYACLFSRAANSYQRHCTDPIASAESDLLGKCVEALRECRDREYNPFEPDNQTALHGRLTTLLSQVREGARS